MCGKGAIFIASNICTVKLHVYAALNGCGCLKDFIAKRFANVSANSNQNCIKIGDWKFLWAAAEKRSNWCGWRVGSIILQIGANSNKCTAKRWKITLPTCFWSNQSTEIAVMGVLFFMRSWKMYQFADTDIMYVILTT